MTVFFRTIVIFAVAGNAFADQITIPNTFTPATRAVAAEVNQNFSALVTESNAQDVRIAALAADSDSLAADVDTLATEVDVQDQRIAALELQVVTDQLFCVGSSRWAIDGSVILCRQSSSPVPARSLSFVQVVAEGWIGVAVAGSPVTTASTYIFSR